MHGAARNTIPVHSHTLLSLPATHPSPQQINMEAKTSTANTDGVNLDSIIAPGADAGAVETGHTPVAVNAINVDSVNTSAPTANASAAETGHTPAAAVDAINVDSVDTSAAGVYLTHVATVTDVDATPDAESPAGSKSNAAHDVVDVSINTAPASNAQDNASPSNAHDDGKTADLQRRAKEVMEGIALDDFFAGEGDGSQIQCGDLDMGKGKSKRVASAPSLNPRQRRKIEENRRAAQDRLYSVRAKKIRDDDKKASVSLANKMTAMSHQLNSLLLRQRLARKAAEQPPLTAQEKYDAALEFTSRLILTIPESAFSRRNRLLTEKESLIIAKAGHTIGGPSDPANCLCLM